MTAYWSSSLTGSCESLLDKGQCSWGLEPFAGVLWVQGVFTELLENNSNVSPSDHTGDCMSVWGRTDIPACSQGRSKAAGEGGAAKARHLSILQMSVKIGGHWTGPLQGLHRHLCMKMSNRMIIYWCLRIGIVNSYLLYSDFSASYYVAVLSASFRTNRTKILRWKGIEHSRTVV